MRTTTNGETRRLARVTRIIAMALGAALLAPLLSARPAAASVAPMASFDWSVPERFGPDRNGDGLIDYVDGASDHATGYDATPTSFRVDLDACGSTPGAAISWTVVDQPDPAVPLVVRGGPGCDQYWFDAPEEGAYRIELTAAADGATTTVRREVVVQDWLIVALGDSYGSGEGAPDIPIDTGALLRAQEAWDAVGAAIQDLVELEADLGPLNEAIADWGEAASRLGACGDVADCAYWLGQVTYFSGVVIVELVAFGVETTVETVGDAIDAVESLIDAVKAEIDRIKLIAKSLTGGLSARWQSTQCHRSANAGAAQAARDLELADPKTSVTFVHLACSGATMAYGLLGWYAGTEPVGDNTDESCNPPAGSARPIGCVEPQIQVAKRIVGDREVDATTVSIGGNDAHFADIVIACIAQEPCDSENPVSDPGRFLAEFCPGVATGSFVDVIGEQCRSFFGGLPSLMATASELLEEGINGSPTDPKYPGLAVGYSRLDHALVGDSAEHLLPSSDSARVYISEYVDAVRRDDGAFCDWGSMGFDAIPGMSAAESAFVDNTIIPTLHSTIAGSAAEHGWTYVGGIHAGFRNHGYCAADHYIVRAQETFLIEGRYHGMVHPNAKGYRVYADNILREWRSDFYPTGSLAAPRRADQAPFPDAGPGYTVAEGDEVRLIHESWDSDHDPITYAWSHDRPGRATITDPTAENPNLRGVDDVGGTVTVRVSDEDGGPRADTAPFTVTNVAPVVEPIAGLTAPIRLGTPAQATAPFTDPGVLDTHSATWEWGDGSTSPAVVSGSGGSGTVSGSHTYAAPGIYTVGLTVRDDDGGVATAVHQYAVVYDPEGGFATGGGWLESPPGAHTPDDHTDPDVVGRAQFAFISKYAKGATVPTGSTSFKFSAGDLDFSSTSYDWMVISGTKVTYRGSGELNGIGGHRFVLSAVDDSPDRIRMRIWNDVTGVVVYDNQAAEGIDASARTAIGGGQIQIHPPKKG